MSSLGKRRLEAVLAIATYAVGSSTASATPTLGIEVPKQIVLTASDIAMYTYLENLFS